MTEQVSGASANAETGSCPTGQAPSGLDATRCDPARVSYEARVQSAHLPTRTVAFTFPETGVPFRAGMFRIEFVRQATAEDEIDFPIPEDEICALCGREQEWK